ncbi:MAG: CRTAC1 family protein, partial [Acidobacteriota bacterium]
MSPLLRATLAGVTLVVAVGCQRPPAPAPAASTPLTVGLNHGVAQMGRYDFSAAAGDFAALAQEHPQSPEVAFNLALALVNRQRDGDGAAAERLLRGVLRDPAVGTRASYVLGLLLLYGGHDREAFPLLRDVAADAPSDAFPAYFAGQARLATAPAEALTWFAVAQALDPLLRSAHYGAFQALQRLGRGAEAEKMLGQFQSLESDPRAEVAEFKYTRMGPLALAITVDEPSAPGPAPTGPPFLAATPLPAPAGARWRASGADPRSLTVADIDGDGRLDIFAANVFDSGPPNAVYFSRRDGWHLDLSHPLAAVSGVRAALWGDVDNDGRIDVVLVRATGGTALWRQTAPNIWRDVTRESRAATPRLDGVDGALVDADHDGDLDIWLVNGAGPNELLNNNGNGTFQPIAVRAGIAGDGRPSTGIAVVDLDHDRDHDLVVLHAAPPQDVFVNDLVWHYRRASGFDDFTAAAFDSVLGADLDADGQTELYTTGPRGLERWTPDRGGVWRAAAVAPAAAVAGFGSRLAVADTNGDGSLEVLATHGRTWQALDVAAAGGAAAAAALDGGDAVLGWTVASLDDTHGPSVLGVGSGGLVEWKPGPGRHPYLTLSVTGRDQASDQLRSNVSGLGTRLAVRVESRWTAFDTARPQSGPGQSLQPVSVGLGGAARADFVSLTWPDGVLQTEIALEGGQRHVIAETQRQLSSCPVLFAFNGTALTFVTDLLGVGGIGFFERPGVYSAPYPREHLLFPEGSIAPRDGRYEIVIGEPMEEVTYLDRASLVAYDLPPGWRMTLDERKGLGEPMPTSAPIFYREERLPTRAINDRGVDVTALVNTADLRAAPPGAPDARFIGLTAPHLLELEFDRALDRGPGRPVLMLDGWVEYPYAQTAFAAWQAGAA